jgi:hypothetical protein
MPSWLAKWANVSVMTGVFKSRHRLRFTLDYLVARESTKDDIRSVLAMMTGGVKDPSLAT